MSLRHDAAAVIQALAEHRLLPLLALSLAASSMVIGRVLASGTFSYLFLIWNLFLAWIPWILGLAVWALDRLRAPSWVLAGPGSLWLLLLPNAPYIATDLWLLLRFRIGRAGHGPISLGYDAGMHLLFTITGCYLAVASLRGVHGIVARRTGPRSGWSFALACIALSGLGIYLGRVLRWNSWDVFVRPAAVVGDVLERLVDPLGHGNAWALSTVFAVFFLACYLGFVRIAGLDAAERPAVGAGRGPSATAG